MDTEPTHTEPLSSDCAEIKNAKVAEYESEDEGLLKSRSPKISFHILGLVMAQSCACNSKTIVVIHYPSD